MKALCFLLLVGLVGLSEATFGRKCYDGDFTCIDRRAFCHGGQTMRCPDGTRCVTPPFQNSRCQRSPCVADRVNDQCPFGDFVCMSDKTFCHGGYEMACAPGTVCRGMAPCVSARPPPVRRQCKGWNYQCNGLASFCLGGQIMACPAGTMCLGWAPCVSPWAKK